jgi:DNA-binding CsgD family transcriptional regulator
MRRSPSADRFRRMSGFLREIYQAQDTGSLYAAICGRLGELVAGDNVFIGEHDMERTLITGCVVRHLFETPDFITIVNGSAGQHPLWEPIRTGGQIVRSLSDHASAHAWENTLLYREALGHEGVRDHLSIEFGDRQRRIVSVGVFRAARGFSTREHETMALLIPHLEQALENARLMDAFRLPTAGPATLETSAKRVVLALDPDGRPESLDVLARDLLQRFFRGPIRADRLPAELAAWVGVTRALLDRGAPETAPSPFRLQRGPASLDARLLRARGTPGYLLLLHPNTRHGLIERPLTPRESEVLHWVREGKRNEEIALILDIGKTTVKTHLKHIFQKLGVENRTTAARLAARAVPPS